MLSLIVLLIDNEVKRSRNRGERYSVPEIYIMIALLFMLLIICIIVYNLVSDYGFEIFN